MKPLVSILIPAYNAEPWLGETVESALAQTWPRKEIIVVDDGSSDGTLAIARRFASNQVSVVAQPNQGAAAARNKALAVSQGDYIQWLDADDLLAADKIERQMDVLAQCGSRRTLASSPWGSFIYRVHKADFQPTQLWDDLSPLDWMLRKLGQNLYMQTATWLMNRELADAAGPWNTRMLSDDDGEYFCRVILASDRIRFVPDARTFYRVVGFTRLSYIGRSSAKMDAQFGSMQLHIQYIRSLEDSERVRAACVTYLQNWLIYFYPDRPDIVRQAEELAASLGGHLHPPELSWKYSWIRDLFGWELAKRAHLCMPRLKRSCVRLYDRMLYRLNDTKSIPPTP